MAAAGKIWCPELNKMAGYRDLLNHPNKKICELWTTSSENEFARLFDGYNGVEGINVMEWIAWDAVPKHKTVTYARYVVAYRPEKAEQYRTRITVGGDKLDYNGDVSTRVSTMETFKMLLNSTVSTPGAKCSLVTSPTCTSTHFSQILNM